MTLRIRMLSGCLALGAAAIIMSGTAAQAATGSVAHVSAVAHGGGGVPGGSDIPMAAGGGAVALIAAPLAMVGFRRWRGTHAA
jgi:hypothetical protein